MKIRHGIDSIRISRIKRAVERLGQPFLDRVWTVAEQEYCQDKQGGWKYQSLAARFAAKEAVAKALGLGLLRNGIALTSIEVVSDSFGCPSVNLYAGALSRYEELAALDMSISLTHDGDLAQASSVILLSATVASLPVKEALQDEA